MTLFGFLISNLFMTHSPIPPSAIREAHTRIAPYITRTPLLESHLLNQWLGHTVLFKAESYQRTGAFKARGALNTLLTLKEQDKLPQKVVAFSSGNHAQAVAWAGKQLGVDITIYLPQFVSAVKKQATESYGAKVVITSTRQEAEELCAKAVQEGALLIPPFDHDSVIIGQGTSCLEALEDGAKPDAVFVPCGGGGVTSGTYLATRLLAPETLVYAGEPRQANDASQSYHAGRIIGFDTSPPTIADGVRTPRISERTFQYLRQLNGFYEIEEAEIIYWTQWLTHLLKTSCEPTSAVAMAAAWRWLRTQESAKRVLILLTGGNIDAETQKRLWTEDYLKSPPSFTGFLPSLAL